MPFFNLPGELKREMKRIIVLLIFISSQINAQNEVSADWNISVDGNQATLSIVEFNNFTIGLDGHWHYILNDEEYIAVHDVNDVVISGLQDGEHTIHVWLVDHMHNALDPPVEETITFVINTGLSNVDNEIVDLMVYPNPVVGNYISILTKLEGIKEIQIFTLTGRKVIDTVLDGEKLNLSSLNNGYYLLKVTVNRQSNIAKLILR